MVQESKYNVIIIGGGPAGCMCAYFLQKFCNVIVLDKKSPLLTLLPTGGGRCNLAHAEYDFKELAANYPRGEKFLYSIFSRFSTQDTIEFFNSIGIETYAQDDNRIFPKSNSAKDVREKLLKSLKIRFIKEEALRINKCESTYSVVTNLNSYKTDFVVISTGGHASFEIIRLLGHNIIDLKPSLTGLETIEDFSSISGVSVDDVLFTHKGVSGPKIYKISALNAGEKFPYKLHFDFWKGKDLQGLLNNNPHKSIKNLLAELLPKSFVEYVLDSIDINKDKKCHEIDGKTRDKIVSAFSEFEITVKGTVPDGEVVMSGGVDLKEINPKTLESKLFNNIYFCGEVLDIDGFCGGFNLQNCWSTGYVAAASIIKKTSPQDYNKCLT